MKFLSSFSLLAITFLVIGVESRCCQTHHKCGRKEKETTDPPFHYTCELVDCRDNKTCIMTCPPAYCPPRCPGENVACPVAACIRAEPFCVCSDGYVTSPNNEKNECILKEDCPASECDTITCGPHSKCIYGCEPCLPTCSNPNPACIALCRNVGTYCVCDEGYVHGPGGQCILESECLTPTCQTVRCTENSTCVVDCPECRPSCDYPNPICDKSCVEKAAFCRCHDGYLLTRDGNCISKDDCFSLNCGRNEIFTECEKACYPTCNYNVRSCNRTCPDNARKECECAPGFVHASNGACIPEEKCPPDTSPPPMCAEKPCHYPNETCINGCKTGYCAPTCENARPDCLQVDCTTAEPFCICSEGYIIGPEGNCIQKGECPPIVSECAATLCPPNTTCSVGCPPSCPATCPPKHDCPQLVPCEKESAQCLCLKGYVKDAAGNCILKKDCPKCLSANAVCTSSDQCCGGRFCCAKTPIIRPGDLTYCLDACLRG